MNKKIENVFFKVTGILAILLLMLVVYIGDGDNKESNEDSTNIHNESINKNEPPEKNDIIGEFIVKTDKNSKLIINDNGEYKLYINLCNGYLETSGEYELIENKLRLLNEKNYSEYPSLAGNHDFSLTIIDDNTIRLDEDLVCLFQNTLFER